MVKIIADHRERASGILQELAKKNIEVEMQQLLSADFIISTKDRGGIIHNVGVERKTTNDFLNSIIDKRIIQQLIVLKENFTIPLLIIEVESNIYQIRDFHPNAIRGMLAAIAIDMQIPILYTRNYRDTAALLSVIAHRLEKPRSAFSLLKKKKPLSLKEQQEYIIETLPGIGPSLAKALLKEFESVKKVINAKEEHLRKVEKIGPKKAKRIREVIDTGYQER